MTKSRFVPTVLLAAVCAIPASADVVISTDATQNMSCSGGVCAPTASDAVLNVTDLENLLASGNVSVVTTNGSVQANNIGITAPFLWSSVSGLTLDAYESISFSAAVTVRSNLGSVSLTTNDGGSGGNLTFATLKGNLDFRETTSALSINGKHYKLVSNLKGLAAAVVANPDGRFALTKFTDAGKDGLYYNSPIPITFSGSFNGLGHIISSLEIADTSSQTVGLFAKVGKRGSIASVALRNSVVRGAQASIGALAGENDGAVSNAFASGTIQGSAAGGLIGSNNGNITTSQSAAAVNGKSEAGGLAGGNSGTIELSFATGNITGIRAGGLVGASGTDAVVENCYALGAATGKRKYANVGGFAGFNYKGSISASYSIGAVSGGKNGTVVGGFDGTDEGTISNSYWDTETSGTDKGSGDGNETGLTGLTTAQFQSGLPSGFDPAIWAEDANINNGFPYLIANPPAK